MVPVGTHSGKQTLERYFNETTDNSYGAREIINGDKSKVPSWSNGVCIGNLIKGYHIDFLAALEAAVDAYRPAIPAGHTLVTATLELLIGPDGKVVHAEVLDVEKKSDE